MKLILINTLVFYIAYSITLKNWSLYSSFLLKKGSVINSIFYMCVRYDLLKCKAIPIHTTCNKWKHDNLFLSNWLFSNTLWIIWFYRPCIIYFTKKRWCSLIVFCKLEFSHFTVLIVLFQREFRKLLLCCYASIKIMKLRKRYGFAHLFESVPIGFISKKHIINRMVSAFVHERS